MKKVLFDTNIILDIALQRESFFENAFKLFELIDQNRIAGYITASTVTDIYYIAKKEKGHTESLEFIKGLIEVVELVGIDKETIQKALKYRIKDFEDAIQVSAVEINEIDCIITRNTKDFKNIQLDVYSPKEFLSLEESHFD